MAAPATATPIALRILDAETPPFVEGIAKRSFNCNRKSTIVNKEIRHAVDN